MPLVNVTNSLHSDDALLWLITFSDPASKVVLRAVNNLEDVTSRGQKFTAFPFEVTLQPDDGERFQTLSLVFPHVGQELSELIRGYAPETPPQVKLELVLANSPNTVEKTVDFLHLTVVTYDAMAINMTLAPANIFQRKTCQARYSTHEFPGLGYALT